MKITDRMMLDWLDNVPNLQLEIPRKGIGNGWDIYRFDWNQEKGHLRETIIAAIRAEKNTKGGNK